MIHASVLLRVFDSNYITYIFNYTNQCTITLTVGAYTAQFGFRNVVAVFAIHNFIAKLIKAFPKRSTDTLSCFKMCNTIRKADLRPMPGSRENSLTASSKSLLGYDINVYYLCKCKLQGGKIKMNVLINI